MIFLYLLPYMINILLLLLIFLYFKIEKRVHRPGLFGKRSFRDPFCFRNSECLFLNISRIKSLEGFYPSRWTTDARLSTSQKKLFLYKFVALLFFYLLNPSL